MTESERSRVLLVLTSISKSIEATRQVALFAFFICSCVFLKFVLAFLFSLLLLIGIARESLSLSLFLLVRECEYIFNGIMRDVSMQLDYSHVG